MPAIAEQGAAAAYQREIHSPGVDAQSVDAAMLCRTAPQSRQHFRVEPQDVPVEAAQCTYWSVGKAMHDFEFQGARRQRSRGRPCRFRHRDQMQAVSYPSLVTLV